MEAMQKRRFLKLIVLGIGAVPAVIGGIPALLTAFSPLIGRSKEPEWRVVGRLEQFPLNRVTKTEVELLSEDWARTVPRKGLYVSRLFERELIVFSRSCTDLSCPVKWDPGSACFFCPCHGGVFNSEGERLAGPPKRPLYRYKWRVREGLLEVDLNSLPPIA